MKYILLKYIIIKAISDNNLGLIKKNSDIYTIRYY